MYDHSRLLPDISAESWANDVSQSVEQAAIKLYSRGSLSASQTFIRRPDAFIAYSVYFELSAVRVSSRMVVEIAVHMPTEVSLGWRCMGV